MMDKQDNKSINRSSDQPPGDQNERTQGDLLTDADMAPQWWNDAAIAGIGSLVTQIVVVNESQSFRFATGVTVGALIFNRLQSRTDTENQSI